MPALYLKFSSYLSNGEIGLAEDADERQSSICWGVFDESLLQAGSYAHAWKSKLYGTVLLSIEIKKKKRQNLYS